MLRGSLTTEKILSRLTAFPNLIIQTNVVNRLCCLVQYRDAPEMKDIASNGMPEQADIREFLVEVSILQNRGFAA